MLHRYTTSNCNSTIFVKKKKTKIHRAVFVCIWICVYSTDDLDTAETCNCVFFMFTVSCIADKLYLITVQRDATINSLFIILQVHSTCFGCHAHPSSGIHKTVCKYSLRYWSYFFVQLLPSNVATTEGGSCTNIWPVPEAVVTVLCTPDDRCGWHPKHVVKLQNNK